MAPALLFVFGGAELGAEIQLALHVRAAENKNKGEARRCGINRSRASASEFVRPQTCKPIQLWHSRALNSRQLIQSFTEDGDAFPEGFFANCEGRCDLHGLAPGANRRKEEQPFLEAPFDDGVG